jgi:thiol-disulfide isomerase/thioredoxin
MSRTLLGALAGVILLVAASAEDDPQAAARSAFDGIQQASQAMRAAGQDAAARKAAYAELEAARERFRDAFSKSDWSAWDAAKDKDLLVQGLLLNGFKALEGGDGATAKKAFETLATKMPDLAAQFLGAQASAYALSDGIDKARAFVEKAANGADEKQKPGALVLLGDYKAALGEALGARKDWEAAVAGVPEGLDVRSDPRPRAKSDAEMRLALVGTDAPEIAASTWIDGDQKPLSALKGSVVVVDFWATWCPPCRQVMPGLDALYQQKKESGLVLLGVTRFYSRGFMPNAGTKDPLRDGEAVNDIAEDAFLDHLKQFKSNVGLTYPFAIATEAEFKAYRVQGIPTLVVVGRDGKVAFLKVGGGDETLLKLAVDRALAAKS